MQALLHLQQVEGAEDALFIVQSCNDFIPTFPTVLNWTRTASSLVLFAIACGYSEFKVQALMAQLGVMAFVLWD